MPRLPDGSDHEAIDQHRASDTAILTVDLIALENNYKFLDQQSGNAECAAVVKADAYGLGVTPAALSLERAGCRTFFVANLHEACELRSILIKPVIFNMGGLFPGTAERHVEHSIFPVLNTLDEVREWKDFCCQDGMRNAGAALQFNTGMNRLGMQCDALLDLIQNGGLEGMNITLIMSHLACGDEPDHPLNKIQLEQFRRVRNILPNIPASLANSAGIFLGDDYHFDIVRPGIALYGGKARIGEDNPMKAVAFLDGRIAQIETVPAGQSVGYGAAQSLKRTSQIATVSVGYADGFFRYLGSSDEKQNAYIVIEGYQAPIVGRVSMDLITVDVTDIPDNLVKRGGFVEILGNSICVDDLAERAGTIGYEILTSLGDRYRREYIY